MSTPAKTASGASTAPKSSPITGDDVPLPVDIAPAPAPAGDVAPSQRPAKRPTTRAGREAARKARTATRKAVTKSEVARSVSTLHTMAGDVLPLVGMPMTGTVLRESADEAGAAWADLVQRYPALERWFGAGTDGLVWFRLLMVYAPVVQVAMAERGGSLSPDLSAAMAAMAAGGGAPAS